MDGVFTLGRGTWRRILERNMANTLSVGGDRYSISRWLLGIVVAFIGEEDGDGER